MICPLCGCPHAFEGCLYLDTNRAGGASNKIWCDYFHRRVVIERVDDFADDDITGLLA